MMAASVARPSAQGVADDHSGDAAGQCMASSAESSRWMVVTTDGNDRREETGHRIGDFAMGTGWHGIVTIRMIWARWCPRFARWPGTAGRTTGWWWQRSPYRPQPCPRGCSLASQRRSRSALVPSSFTMRLRDVLSPERTTKISPSAPARWSFAVTSTASAAGWRSSGKLHQALERVGESCPWASHQHLAHRDEGQDHGSGCKVELPSYIATSSLLPSTTRGSHGEQGVGAPHHKTCHGTRSLAAVPYLGERNGRSPLKPLMKNFWLMTMTMPASSSCTGAMAMWLPSKSSPGRGPASCGP